MNIYELTFTSYVYSSIVDFDKTFKNFLKITNNNPDMSIEANRQALLDWLNDWGCRNFYIKYHALASKELLEWYLNCKSYLPKKNKNIWEFNDNDLNIIQRLYNSLIVKIASHVKKKNGDMRINPFGNTPSSKILFALRPKALIPWDGEMRKVFKQKFGITTYKEYLVKVIEEIEELKISCQKNGFKLEDVPAKLNKSYATIPKLIDEYHWITITRKCEAPDNKTLETWLKWNSQNYL